MIKNTLQCNEVDAKAKGFSRDTLELVAATIDFEKDTRDIIVIESSILNCSLIFKRIGEGLLYVEISDGPQYVHQGITSHLKK